MNIGRSFNSLVAGLTALAAGVLSLGYTLVTDSGGYVVTWPAGSVPMQIKLATSPALSDGTSQSGSVLAAMQAWNGQLGTVQFAGQELGPGTYGMGNDVNEIAMDSTIEGQSFGGNTLAVTVSFRSGNTRVESDIIFNTAWTWDSYRGSLQAPEDIRRVAIHELGHVLGLNHPDQAGQSVTALMNSTVSNVDALQSDDIAGGQILYGAPGFVPGNDNFANATAITLAGTSAQVTGTNVAATAEAGEPSHASEPARRSVWWTWTAPGNGSVTFTTLGSKFDTVLGVYTGASVSSLTEVVSNDDGDPGVIRTGTVAFQASAGTTYYIAVDGWDGYAGTITLNVGFVPTTVYGDASQIKVRASNSPVAGAATTLYLEGGGQVTSCQWRFRGAAIPGATGATLVLPNLSRAKSGFYDAVVTLGGQPFTVEAIKLDVAPAAAYGRLVADADFAPIFESSETGEVTAWLRLPDGRIMIGGLFTKVGDVDSPYLAVLNADGTRYAGFTPPALNGPVQALAAAADGKIYVGGEFSECDGVAAGRLIRLNANLTKDTGFSVGTGFGDAVYALAPLADGRVYVGGAFRGFQGDSSPQGVARLNANGSRDTAFTLNYMASSSSSSRPPAVYALLVQPDGRVVAGGNFANLGSGSSQNLARLSATGQPENPSLNHFGPPGPIYSLLLLSDGRILAGGDFPFVQPWDRGRLVRFNADLNLDTTFDLAASVKGTGAVRAVARLSDGRLLVGGSDGFPTVLLSSEGALAATQPTVPYDGGKVRTIALQSDGTFLVGGQLRASANTGETAKYTVYSPTGDSFSTLTEPVVQGAGTVSHVELLSGGKLLVRGAFTHVNGVPRQGLVRLAADGSVDSAFVPGGVVPTVDTGRFAVQGDGKILIHTGTQLIRLLDTGAVDSGFTAVNYVPADLGLDSAGRPLVSSGATGGLFPSANGLKRLMTTGAVDSTFTSLTVGGGRLLDLFPLPNGSLYAGGQFGQVNGQSANSSFIRIGATGAPDASFNPGYSSETRLWTQGTSSQIYRLFHASVDRFSAAGYRDSTFSYSGTDTALTAMAALPNGTLYRAAEPSIYSVNQPEKFFGRHLATGALDATFIPIGLNNSGPKIREILPLDDGQVILVGPTLRQGESRATQLTRMKIPDTLKATSVSHGTTAAAGDSVSLSVTMAGAGPFSYQWYRNGLAINGATSATLNLGAVQQAGLGEYSVRVSLADGSVAVFGPIPVVAAQQVPSFMVIPPASISTVSGAPVALSVTMVGVGPYQFQWFRDGIAIPGATASVFSLSSVTRANAGIYHVVATDGLAEAKSPPTVLVVTPTDTPKAMDLDTGFAPVIERLGAQVTALTVAADGRVLVGGAFTRVSTVTRNGLARFLADGSLDNSFTPPAFDGPIYAIAIDASGRVIVAGDFVRVGTLSAGRIVRLLADGSIDASFSRSPGFDGPVHALLLQPDGRIVASGAYNQVQDATQAVLARLNTDGSRDTSFAPGFTPGEVVKCMALQSDGKVVTASMPRTESSSGGLQGVTFQRWHSNGTADASFVPNVTPAGYAYTMAILPNGDVLVGGLLAYYGSSGSVYTTTLRMSSAGTNNTAWQTSYQIAAHVRAVAVRPDGHIWMVSASDDGSTGIVRRYSDSGILQASSFSNIPALVAGLLSDGRFLIGGVAGANGLTQNRGLAPIANDGSVSADWSAVFERTATVRALAAAEAGKVYIGGDFRRINGALMNRIARLNADGSLDTGFVIGTGFDNEVSHLIALADGGVMAAGRFSSYNGSAAGPIARLQANGLILPGFVPPGAGISTIAAMHLDTKGRVWLGGEFGAIGGISRQRLARFSATSGELDLAYNPQNTVSEFGAMLPALDASSLVLSGWLTTTYSSDIGRLDDTAAPISNFPASPGNTTKAGALAWLPDEKILSGSQYSSSGTTAFVRRLGADGVYDSSFASPQLAINGVRKLIAQGEGSHLVLGYDGAARIGATGAIDSTFSLSGAVKGKFSDMLLLDDGSLLVSGGLDTSSGRPMALARLKSLAPSIALQPSSLSITTGQPVSFTVGANGSGLSYQWRKDGTDLGNGERISGATAATVTIDGTHAGDAGGYDVIVSNSVGSVISAQALLSFSIASQTITFAPLATRSFTTTPVSLNAVASSGLPVVFSVLSGPATVSGNALTLTGTGTVTVRASQSGDATYAAATPVDRSFVVTANFSSWAQGKFTSGELADVGISGPNADPDSDGYANLVEYALGLEPKDPSSTGLPEMSTTATDWVYTYTRPADRTELAYTVEISTDLASWTTAGVTHELVSSSGGVETWRARFPLASAGNVFFRLKISQ